MYINQWVEVGGIPCAETKEDREEDFGVWENPNFIHQRRLKQPMKIKNSIIYTSENDGHRQSQQFFWYQKEQVRQGKPLIEICELGGEKEYKWEVRVKLPYRIAIPESSVLVISTFLALMPHHHYQPYTLSPIFHLKEIGGFSVAVNQLRLAETLASLCVTLPLIDVPLEPN